MKYLKKASSSARGFVGKFTNGETTKSRSAAMFFMAMQDNGALPDELEGYSHIGKICDPSQDWEEISRIIKTFSAAKQKEGGE